MRTYSEVFVASHDDKFVRLNERGGGRLRLTGYCRPANKLMREIVKNNYFDYHVVATTAKQRSAVILKTYRDTKEAGLVYVERNTVVTFSESSERRAKTKIGHIFRDIKHKNPGEHAKRINSLPTNQKKTTSSDNSTAEVKTKKEHIDEEKTLSKSEVETPKVLKQAVKKQHDDQSDAVSASDSLLNQIWNVSRQSALAKKPTAAQQVTSHDDDFETKTESLITQKIDSLYDELMHLLAGQIASIEDSITESSEELLLKSWHI